MTDNFHPIVIPNDLNRIVPATSPNCHPEQVRDLQLRSG